MSLPISMWELFKRILTPNQYRCPRCNLPVRYKVTKFCENCGQPLTWRGVK